MAAFTKYEVFSEDLAKGVHDLNGDTLVVMLTNTAPNVATHTVRAHIAEIAGGSGYTSGGHDTQNATSRAGGVTSVTGSDVTITAAGGDIGPFRYVVLGNQTASGTPLIGYWDRGSSITLSGANGDFVVTDFGASMFTVT